MQPIPETEARLSSGDVPTAQLDSTGGDRPMPSAEAIGILRPALAAGEIGRLGGYRIVRVLGQGGMGVVFLAEDPALGRSVAVKAMLPTVATSARERFLREARAAAVIKDDHVVTIHQVGEDNGVPFLVMELLDGESLADRVAREGRLPIPEVVRIGRELANGLAAAHAKGLLHRDVKPANAWLEGPTGRVKLLDFGLARSVSGGAELTKSGAILGTPAYMPPEQARGEPTDPRSDLFSLGAVLYQLATGERPFRGDETMAVLLAVVQFDPTPPSRVRTEVPSALSALIMRLLAKKPSDRPGSAVDVSMLLAKIGSSEPAPVVGNRRPWLIAGILIALASLIGIAFASGLFNAKSAKTSPSTRLDEKTGPDPLIKPNDLPKKTDPPVKPKEPPPKEPKKVEPKPPTPSPSPSATPIDSLTRSKHVPTNRPNAPDNVVAIAHGESERYTVVAFSPDGKSMAVGARNGTVHLWDIATWTSQVLPWKAQFGDDVRVRQVEFSPDGQFVAAALNNAGGAIHVWHVPTQRGAGGDAIKYAERSFAFNRVDGSFATGGRGKDSEVRVYDLGPDHRIVRRNVAISPTDVDVLAFTPTGDRLLAFRRDRKLSIWDPKTGTGQPLPDWWITNLGANLHSVAFSRSGERIAFPTEYHTYIGSAVLGRSKIRQFEPTPGLDGKVKSDAMVMANVAFGPNDDLVVTGYSDGTVRLCEFSAGRATWRTLASFPKGRVWSVAFSPEGRHIAAIVGSDAHVIRLALK